MPSVRHMFCSVGFCFYQAFIDLHGSMFHVLDGSNSDFRCSVSLANGSVTDHSVTIWFHVCSLRFFLYVRLLCSLWFYIALQILLHFSEVLFS